MYTLTLGAEEYEMLVTDIKRNEENIYGHVRVALIGTMDWVFGLDALVGLIGPGKALQVE